MKDNSENERVSRLIKFNFKKSKKSYLCGEEMVLQGGIDVAANAAVSSFKGEMVPPRRDRRRGECGDLEF
jgi:hypothetical protein